jgi:hypothetical protein
MGAQFFAGYGGPVTTSESFWRILGLINRELTMNMPRLKAISIVALAALFAPALFALDIQNAPAPNSAVPGTVNYIEGSATLNGQPVGRNAVGYATVTPGGVIATTQGRAEVLLTPGVFLRLGNNSAAQMVTPDLTNTVVNVEHGRAAVEVDQLFKQNDIQIVVDNVPVQLVKPGFYEFDADRGAVMVFKGEAVVSKGNGKWVTIKDHRDLNVAEGTGAALKTAKFDVNQQEQRGLYQWSSLRSEYLAEASSQIAPQYGVPGYAPGWYWSPYMLDYTFLGPYPFYSPFGWGFYPFGYVGFGGFYGGGFYGYRGGFAGGGFHGGGFGGGGFRGGGGLDGGHGR